MRQPPVDTIKYRGCTIEVHHDDDHENPREWDNLGTMVCFHDRYNLGDKPYARRGTGDDVLRELASAAVNLKTDAENIPDKHIERILAKHYVMLNLYLYDHSGITMSSSPFSCPWDSGRVGFMHCSLKKAIKNWTSGDQKPTSWDSPIKSTTKDGETTVTLRQAVVSCLEGEVETYDDHLTGNVYYYMAKAEDGETIDSCGGFFPEHGVPYAKENDYMIGEAKAAIDGFIQNRANKRRAATLAAKKEAGERQHWAERDVVTA